MKLVLALVAAGYVLTLLVWPQIKRVNRDTPSDKQASHARLLDELRRHE